MTFLTSYAGLFDASSMLSGEKGDPGLIGDPGTSGLSGANGKQGPGGHKGIQGDKGQGFSSNRS